MDLATLKIRIEGDSRSFDTAVDQSKRKLQSFASDAAGNSTVKLKADATGVTQGVNKGKSAVQAFSRTKADVKLTADASGVARGVSNAKRSLGSLPSKVDVMVTVKETGAASTRAAIQGVANEVKQVGGQSATVNVKESGANSTQTALRGVNTEANQLNGQAATINVREQGAASTKSSLMGVKQERDNLNSQGVNIPWNSSGAESGAARLGQGMRSLAIDIRALISVGSVMALPGLVAALGTIPTLATAAAAGIVGLTGALAGGLVGAATSAGAALGLLGGAVGLISAPMSMLGSKFKEYESGLNAAQSATDGASSATTAYDSALSSLESAQTAVGDAVAAAEEKVSQASQAYTDSLDQVAEAERSAEDARVQAAENAEAAAQAYADSLDAVASAEQAAEDARVQANENSEAAVQAYADSLRAVEDAERAAQDARMSLEDATETLTQAQQDLNQAMRDEPLNQAEADLERREALLGQAEAADRLADAQNRLAEADTGEEQADAHLAIEQAMLGQERAAIRAERAQNSYYDTSTQGSDQLLSAQEGVESAYEAQQNALRGISDADADVLRAREESGRAYEDISKTEAEGMRSIADADKALLKARLESGRKYDDIAKAEAEGMRSIEDADRALMKAREESGRKYDDIAKAQAEGQKQVNEALKRVADAERQVADAANKMAAGQDNAKVSSLALSAAQAALFDRWIAFKHEANDAFGPAQDSLAHLGIAMMDLASQYLPAVGAASYNTAEALRGAFAEFETLLGDPNVDSAIMFILDQIPVAAGLAGSAVANFGTGAIMAFSRAVPYGISLLESVQGLSTSFSEWATSAEGIAQIDAFLAGVNETASRLGAVIADLGGGFYNLWQSLKEAGIPEQMLGGLESMAQNFRDITTEGTASRQALDEFFVTVGPILTALGTLGSTIVSEFLRVASVVGTLQGSTEGLTLMEEIIYALNDAMPSFASMFIGFVEGVGPVLVDLIPKFGELAEIIGRNSGVIQNILEELTVLLNIFLALPDPVQDFITKMIVGEAVMAAVFGTTLTGGIIKMGKLFLQFSAFKTLRDMGKPAQELGDSLDDVGTKSDNAKSKLGGLSSFLSSFVVAAIVVDILINLPDMAAAFSSTYEQARTEGDGVGTAFMEAMSAAISETTTGTLAFAVADAINAAAPDVTIWDVITGQATADEAAASGNLIAKLANVMASGTNWLLGYTPETTFQDVLMGRAEDSGEGPIGWLQAKMVEIETWLASWMPSVTIMDLLMGNATMEDAEGAGGLAGLLVQVQTGLGAVDEWLASWAPSVTIMDLLMGNATLEDAEGAGGLAGLLPQVQSAVTSVGEWIASLEPDITLMDVFSGEATTGEAAESGNPLAGFLVNLQSGWSEVESWWSGVDSTSMMETVTSGMLAGLEPLFPGVTELFGRVKEEGIDGTLTEAQASATAILGTWTEEVFGVSLDQITARVEAWGANLRDGQFNVVFAEIGQLLFDFLSGWIENTFGVNLDAMQARVTAWLTTLRDEGFVAFFTEIGQWVYDTLAGWIENTFGINIDAMYARVEAWLITLRDQGFIAFFTEIGVWVFDTLAGWIENTFGVNIDAIWARVEAWLITLRDEGFIAFITEIATFLYDELNRWVEEVFGVSLDAIIEQAVEFGKGFYDALAGGIEGAINAAIGLLNGLLGAIDTVLGAINVSPLGITIETVSISKYADQAAEHGLMTTDMHNGGSASRKAQSLTTGDNRKTRRGGKGTHTARDQFIRWNEQSNGPEFWVASGDPNKQRQQNIASQAARSVGLATVPMEHGGAMYREMAIGGGTDLGPGGLSGQAAEIANEVMSMFGVWANTYTDYGAGTIGEHGSQHGNTPENTFDFWGDSGFSPLDPATGDAIKQHLYDNYGSSLDTVIWSGSLENAWGAWPDEEHYDHLHAAVGGSGLANVAGAVAGRLMQIAKSTWETAISALGIDGFDMGGGALWDGMEEYLKTIPSMAWNFLLSKIPRGTGGFSGGQLSGDIMSMLEQGIKMYGWDQTDLDALITLWGNESNMDPNAVNPDSGAYGIPQILPEAHGNPVPLGDAAAQIAWGMDYIANHPIYGDPSGALDFWYANNWYKKGGRVPGRGAQRAMVHGGERVLTEDQNSIFEAAMGVRGGPALAPLGEQELAFVDADREEIRQDRRTLQRQNDELIAEMRDMKRTLAEAMREPFDITDEAANKIKPQGGGVLLTRPENVREGLRNLQEAVADEDNFAGRRW